MRTPLARRPDLYDTIGTTYRKTRRADSRLTLRIRSAVGDASTVVNIGAGTGSYEPADCTVIAVEPSWVMIRQRSGTAAPAVRAVAISRQVIRCGDGPLDDPSLD